MRSGLNSGRSKTDVVNMSTPTHVGFFSKTGSDTFRSVLIYGKEQESLKKNVLTVKKNHLHERV